MLYNFSFSDFSFTTFVFVNWLLTASTTAAFAYIFVNQRFQLLRPSALLAGMAHILFQWPLAIYASFYETWLPRPYEAVILVHGFVIAGLIGSQFLLRGIAEEAWERLGNVRNDNAAASRYVAIAVLGGLIVIGTVIYLSYVPFDCTGLYALTNYPIELAVARELSLKLVGHPLPRYSLTFLTSTIVPLLTGVIAAQILAPSPRKTLQLLLLLPLLILAWLAGDMIGAKSTLAYFSLVIVAAIYLYKRFEVSKWFLPLAAIICLAPPYLITLAVSVSGTPKDTRELETCFARVQSDLSRRGSAGEIMAAIGPEHFQRGFKEGWELSISLPRMDDRGFSSSLWNAGIIATEFVLNIGARLMDAGVNALTQLGAILYRIVVVPFEVGAWFIHYEQTNGPMGVGAIPRLAQLLNLPPIDGPNRIGITYGPEYYGHSVSPTISAGAGFLMSYFAYFGIWSVPLSILLLWLTDSALLAYRWIDSSLLVPLAAALTVSLLKFLESDYTTAWVTHGFGVMIVIAIAISILVRAVKRPAGYAA